MQTKLQVMWLHWKEVRWQRNLSVHLISFESFSLNAANQRFNHSLAILYLCKLALYFFSVIICATLYIFHSKINNGASCTVFCGNILPYFFSVPLWSALIIERGREIYPKSHSSNPLSFLNHRLQFDLCSTNSLFSTLVNTLRNRFNVSCDPFILVGDSPRVSCALLWFQLNCDWIDTFWFVRSFYAPCLSFREQ